VIKGEVKDVVLLDVLPLSLGVETQGGLMTTIIERNTTIPARRTETFSTAEDNQTAVDVVVLQGERELASENRVLGRFRLEGIRPAPRGVPQIEVTFDVDANGILHVTARDKDTGAEQSITITESSRLDESEVERMINDAEAHREEDKRIRQEIDARNELDSVAHQVQRMLEQAGDVVPSHERSRAELLINDAREAVKNQDGLDRVRQLTSELQQIAQSLQSARPAGDGAAATASGNDNGSASGERAAADDDDVIDAEFTVS
jgi:molecular chaperone DnaK